MKMTLYKWGLTCNLIGSILLGLHIIGMKRLKSWENKIRHLPGNVSLGILIFVLSVVFKIGIKLQIKSRAGELKRWQLGFINYFKKGSISFPKDWALIRRNPLLNKFFMFVISSIIIWVALWIAFSPLIFALYLATKPFALIQDKLQIESLFGMFGILFLIIGFILQILA